MAHDLVKHGMAQETGENCVLTKMFLFVCKSDVFAEPKWLCFCANLMLQSGVTSTHKGDINML